MAENVVENAQAEAEAVIAEAEAITDSAAAVLEASNGDTPSISNARSTNGASGVISEAVLIPELSAEELARREMNRREFLMYSWAGSLALVGAVSGYATFAFLYPRFRKGQFGGKFDRPVSDFGDKTTPPKGLIDGKFWMVTTADGSPKAIYMVCTHLGCLYKWSDSNGRFECPCHGSKFSHDGFYIEGPAPRSLDYFNVAVEGDLVIVDTGAKQTGGPAAESPAKAVIA